MPLLSLSPLVPRGPCLRPVRPGRSLSASGRGGSLGPVRDRIGDRYRRGRSGAYGRELLVITGLPSGDRGEAPYVKETPQPLVAGRSCAASTAWWYWRRNSSRSRSERSLRITSGSAGLPSAVWSRDSAYARRSRSACQPHGPGRWHFRINLLREFRKITQVSREVRHTFASVLSSNGQNCAQCRVTSMAIQDNQ